jgi:hypothetical protein
MAVYKQSRSALANITRAANVLPVFVWLGVWKPKEEPTQMEDTNIYVDMNSSHQREKEVFRGKSAVSAHVSCAKE